MHFFKVENTTYTRKLCSVDQKLANYANMIFCEITQSFSNKKTFL